MVKSLVPMTEQSKQWKHNINDTKDILSLDLFSPLVSPMKKKNNKWTDIEVKILKDYAETNFTIDQLISGHLGRNTTQ